VKVLGLGECGTHAVIDAHLGGVLVAVGCSSSTKPAPPSPTTSQIVQSKASQLETRGPNSFAPTVTANPAPTALPGNVNTGLAR
jgi:hypothetical protein